MKIKLKFIAGIIAAVMAVTGLNVCAFAEGEGGTPPASATNDEPYLGSGAVNGGYTISVGSLNESDTSDITVKTYIPIENYDYGRDY